MTIAKVRLYATLRKYAPGIPIGGDIEIDLPSGATVADLALRLQIPPQEIRLTFVNSLQRDDSYIIQEGDEIVLFPPVAGGA